MEVFSARLKWLREKKGLSQKEMADRVGVSQPYYFKFEKNTGEPNLETLIRFPELLGESIEFLLGISDYDKEISKMISEYKSYVYEKKYLLKRLENVLSDAELKKAMEHDQFSSYISKQQEADDRLNEKIGSLRNKIITRLKEIPLIKEESISVFINEEDPL